MLKRSFQKGLSMLVSATMMLTPLVGLAGQVRADGDKVEKNIWAIMTQNGEPDASTIKLLDSTEQKPEGNYQLIGKYINNYEDYELSDEDEGLMILANNSKINTDYDNIDAFRMSGSSTLTCEGKYIASTNIKFDTYEGSDDNVGELLEFYTSDKYEEIKDDSGEIISYPSRYNFEFTGDYEIRDWFSAETLVIDKDVTLSIGYKDDEGWNDGHITAYNTYIYGELKIGGGEGEVPESQIMIFDDISIETSGGVTGKITAFNDAVLTFEKDSACSIDGMTFYARTEGGQLEEFVFEKEHDRYDFVYRPKGDGSQDMIWEFAEFGPDRPEKTFCVDYDDRGGVASVMVGEETINSWEAYEYTPGTAVKFQCLPPEGYMYDYIFVEIRDHVFEDDEEKEIVYRTDLEETDPNYLEFDRENASFEFKTDSDIGFDVTIIWSPYDVRFDINSEYCIETTSWCDGGEFEIIGADAKFSVNDPNGYGTKSIFAKDSLKDGVVVTFTPKAGYEFGDIRIRYNVNNVDRDFHYVNEISNEDELLLSDLEGFTDNKDGSYSLKIDEFPGWFYTVEVGFFKIVDSDGITIFPHEAKVEYKFDDESTFKTLELTTVGEGEGARQDYIIDKDTLSQHDSVTLKFSREQGDERGLEGLCLEYFDNVRCVNILPLGENKEFTLTKGESGWFDYNIDVLEWQTAFDGTFTVGHCGGYDWDSLNVSCEEPNDFEVGKPIIIKAEKGTFAKVVGRLSTDYSNTEFDVAYDESKGGFVYTPDTNSGINFVIYVTEADYAYDHLRADNNKGEREFEIEVNTHGFVEQDPPVQYDGEFTVVKNDNIVGTAVSENRTKVVVNYTDKDISDGKAKVTLNIDPKYDCVYEVFVGDTKIEAVDDTVEIDLANVIAGSNERVRIEMTYDEPLYLLIEGTSEDIVATYSFDGTNFNNLNSDNIINLKDFDGEEITIKVTCAADYKAQKLEFYDLSGQSHGYLPISDDGTVVYSKNDGWSLGKAKIVVAPKLIDTTTETDRTKAVTKFDSVTLTASVKESITSGIAYKWSSSTDGQNYTDMNKTTKSVTVNPEVKTYYKCTVTDAYDNSIEIKFVVDVLVPELKDLTTASAKLVSVEKDTSVSLEAKVNTNETTGITYKWSKSEDGKTFTSVSGQAATLTFKAEASATYRCDVSDKYGNKITITFKVTVTEPEEEQDFGGFIERLYEQTMGRESDPEGKEFWTKSVSSGERTGADCARGFLKSPEFHDKNLSNEEFLKVLYKTFFNREPDEEGMNFWLNLLKTTSQDEVVERFIDSTEWCNVCASYGVKSGASNAKATVPSQNAKDFATRLYTCCLGRQPEESGLNYWSLSLTNLERTGTQAAKEFFYSPEFIGFNTSDEEYVTRLYRTFMGREPEAGGFEFWVGQLKSGAMTRDRVFDGFAASQEFTDICNSYAIER